MRVFLISALACAIFSLADVEAAVVLPLEEEKALQEGYAKMSQEPGAVAFTPPKGWFLADPKAFDPVIKVAVVGKGSSEYPPMLFLMAEPFSGTLKDYLKIVKAKNDEKGDEWKDLGTIRTEAGEASLSQREAKTKWGTEKLMHVILLRNGTIYMLTGAALKNEFSNFYKEFFDSFRSLRINKNVFEMVEDSGRRAELIQASQNLEKSWDEYYTQYKERFGDSSNTAMNAFTSEEFKKTYWNPFTAMLSKNYGDMGSEWQKQMIKHMQNTLLN